MGDQRLKLNTFHDWWQDDIGHLRPIIILLIAMGLKAYMTAKGFPAQDLKKKLCQTSDANNKGLQLQQLCLNVEAIFTEPRLV